MVVYLDALFAVNAIVNVLLLRAAGAFAGREAPLWRALLAGSIGGVYAVFAALPQLQFLGSWLWKIICAAGMLSICFGVGRQTVRMGVWFCILSAAFAGVVLMLSSLFGVGVYMVGGTAVYPINIPALVLMAGISYCAVAVLLRRFGRQSAAEDLRPVTICMAGQKRTFTALMDTGNVLRDPVTGRQVFVLDGRLATDFLPLEMGEMQHPAEAFSTLAGKIPGLRLLPYRAVGVPSGLLLAVKCDWVLLGSKKLSGVTVAFSPSPVGNGTYQVIAGGI